MDTDFCFGTYTGDGGGDGGGGSRILGEPDADAGDADADAGDADADEGDADANANMGLGSGAFTTAFMAYRRIPPCAPFLDPVDLPLASRNAFSSRGS